MSGETPPQSSIPASSRRSCCSGSDRFGGAWTCIRGPEHDAGGGDRGQELLVVGLGRGVHRGARLRAEVLDDHLLDVAVPAVEVADREERLGPLARGSRPIPTRIPVVNGIARRPASSIVRRRTDGTLSGDPKCGPPFSDSRAEDVSSISPIEAATCFRRAISS